MTTVVLPDTHNYLPVDSNSDFADDVILPYTFDLYFMHTVYNAGLTECNSVIYLFYF